MTAVANRWLKNRDEEQADSWPPLRSRALLWGSIMPDVPLTVIAIVTIASDIIRYNFTELGGQFEDMGAFMEANSWTGMLFSDWFFNSPWVKAAHNLFHAPLMTIFYVALGYWAWKNGRKWGPALFWFGSACLVHTLIDIPIHYDDGPLIFFPFEWNYRFMSPVSYWDPERYGTQFTIFEHSLVLIMLIYLGWGWWQSRKARKQNAAVQ